MGRKEKHIAKITDEEEDSENDKRASPPSFAFSSDDEEANQDLSLKIVEKALQMRAAKLASKEDVLGGGGGGGEEEAGSINSSSQQAEVVVVRDDAILDGPSGVAASEVMEKKKKKVKKVESVDQNIIIAEKQETVETIKATENGESVEASAVQMGDNIVLRKLLRGPRYFDPPDSGWGACYNCGEEGHTTVNCTAVKRKKPCFVCGGLGHNAKQCSKAQDCFICKKSGHRAKDCPEKNGDGSRSLKTCLKCGNSGHDMFTCKNDYSLDDLKEIQCYVCKSFGHLCCVNTYDATPGEISCYKCGQLGHSGLACSRLRDETNGAVTPSSCYKCGDEGHFARECPSSDKKGKRKRELSNPKTPRLHKENDYLGYRPAPHHTVKARKKKHSHTEERGLSTPRKSKSRGGWMTEHPGEGIMTPHKSKSRGGWMTGHPGEDIPTPQKSKSRGGWMTRHPGEDITTPQKSKSRGGWMKEHPGEFSRSNSKRNIWRSPVTPSTKSTKIHNFSNGIHSPSSKSSKMWDGHGGTTSNSQGSGKTFHHRFSASRFGNSSSDGHRRSYNWW